MNKLKVSVVGFSPRKNGKKMGGGGVRSRKETEGRGAGVDDGNKHFLSLQQQPEFWKLDLEISERVKEEGEREPENRNMGI